MKTISSEDNVSGTPLCNADANGYFDNVLALANEMEELCKATRKAINECRLKISLDEQERDRLEEAAREVDEQMMRKEAEKERRREAAVQLAKVRKNWLCSVLVPIIS